MTPVLGADLSAAARALLPVPPPDRRRVALRLIRDAQKAAQYREKTGKAHPQLGNGSLAALAVLTAKDGVLPPEPHVDDPDYLFCLICMLSAISKAASLT